MFGSFSGNKLIAIVGPELALWWAGDDCSGSKLFDVPVVVCCCCGCGRMDDDDDVDCVDVECVECRTEVMFAGDEGRGTDD